MIAVLQGIGRGFVFVELIIINSHEFGVPPPWTRVGTWIRRLLRRPRVVQVGGSIEASASRRARAKVRPGDLDVDASESTRRARLERYVEHLDRDLDEMYRAIGERADEVTEAAQQREAEIRAEMDRREEERRRKLRPSLDASSSAVYASSWA